MYTPFSDIVDDFAKIGVQESNNPPDVIWIDVTEPIEDTVVFNFRFNYDINIVPGTTLQIGGFIYLDTDRILDNGLLLREANFNCPNYGEEGLNYGYSDRGFPLGCEYCIDLFNIENRNDTLFACLLKFENKTNYVDVDTINSDIEIYKNDDDTTVTIQLPLSAFDDDVSGCFHFGGVSGYFSNNGLSRPQFPFEITAIDFFHDNINRYGRNCDLATISDNSEDGYKKLINISHTSLLKSKKSLQNPVLYLNIDNERNFRYYKMRIVSYTNGGQNIFDKLIDVTPTTRIADDSLDYSVGDSILNFQLIPKTLFNPGRGAVAKLIFDEAVLNYLINDTATVVFENFVVLDSAKVSISRMYGPKTYIIAQHSTPQDINTLKQNYPNPFRNSTTISITIPKAQEVSVKIYNLLGRLVYTIAEESMDPQDYSFVWDATDLNGEQVKRGIYFVAVQLKDKKKPLVKKMILLPKL